jgi:alpha-glucosidase
VGRRSALLRLWPEIAIKHIRPVMPLLMMRASLEAQQRFAPEKRPYLISRSGCAGMQRYVQTWSGDNRTNWDTLRYNIRMGLGMSLSGLFNVGHDVGGFSGDKPDAELFVRWVQNGVMHPRFTIHSWNDDQTVNEPWMYPGVTPAIRGAIELRYRLLPYLHPALAGACRRRTDAAPDLPRSRARCADLAECDDFLLGRDLLVASVVEPGSVSAASGCRITKPAGTIFTPRVVRRRPVDHPRRAAGKTAAAGARRCRSAA